MNLTWHIVKKDFRRLKLPLLLWTGLLLALFITSEQLVGPASADPDQFFRQCLISLVLLLATGAVAYVLVASLVLEDSLVGTDLFWATRPISGSQLLGAKLTGIFLGFILWPSLLVLPWLFFNGFELPDLALALRGGVAAIGVIALLAMLLGTVTRRSGQFLLWTMVLLVAIPVISGWLASRNHDPLSSGVALTRAVLAGAMLLVSFAGAIGIQYYSRRIRRALVLVVAGLASTLVIACGWNWDGSGLWFHRPDDLSGTTAVTIEWDPVNIKSGVANGDENNLYLNFRVLNLPPDLVVFSGIAEVELRWPDGVVFHKHVFLQGMPVVIPRGNVLHLPLPQPDEASEERRKVERENDQENLRRHMGDRAFSLSHAKIKDGTYLWGGLAIPANLTAKFRDATPAGSVTLTITVARTELLAELPLREGVSASGHGLRLHIAELSEVPPKTRGGAPTQKVVVLGTARSDNLEEVVYCEVDRVHGAAAIIGGGDDRSTFNSLFPVLFSRNVVNVNIPQLWRDGKWIPVPEWLEHYTLAAVGYRFAGNVTREIKSDQIEIQSD